MIRFAHAILRLYPFPWRLRYEDEVVALIDERGVRLTDIADLLRGMLDAHLRPQIGPVLVAAADAPVLPSSGGTLPSGALRQGMRGYGEVQPGGIGLISRRAFMRRVLGAGIGLLSLEFMGGTLAFLWPNVREGLGSAIRVTSLAELVAQFPDWAHGWPFHFAPAQTFLVNAPAARELALGRDASVPHPEAGDIIALWRRCPHLACMVPGLCPDHKRFECRCHGSTYNILGEKLAKGPASRGMDRFPVSIGDDGVLIIDTRQVISGAPAGTVTFRDAYPQDAGCQ